MRTIAIANHKGGACKSTTAVHLAVALGELKKKCLVIDFDSQSHSSIWLGVEDTSRDLLDFFLGDKKLGDIVRPTDYKGVDVIPSSPYMLGIQKYLLGEVGAEILLKKGIESLPKKWDFILTDTPADLGILTMNALAGCKEVLIPLACHFSAVMGLANVQKLVEKMKEVFNPDLKISGIVACRYDERTRHSKEVVKKLKETFGKLLLKSMIKENVTIADSFLYQQPVMAYDSRCRGSENYRKLAKEISRQKGNSK